MRVAMTQQGFFWEGMLHAQAALQPQRDHAKRMDSIFTVAIDYNSRRRKELEKEMDQPGFQADVPASTWRFCQRLCHEAMEGSIKQFTKDQEALHKSNGYGNSSSRNYSKGGNSYNNNKGNYNNNKSNYNKDERSYKRTRD